MPRSEYSWVDVTELERRYDERGNPYYFEKAQGQRIPYRAGAKLLGYDWAQPRVKREAYRQRQIGEARILNELAKEQGKEGGFKPPKPISRSRYWTIVRSFAKENGYDNLNAAKQDSALKWAIKTMHDYNVKERAGRPVDLSGTGKLAQALEIVGLRDPSMRQYNVGETPRTRT